MARRVFIFGAGASKTAGPPVLQDFIDSADDLRRSGGPISTGHFDYFFTVMYKNLRSLYAKSAPDLDNIETVFSLVEMGRLLKRFPGVELAAIDALAPAVRAVLAETVDQRCEFRFQEDRQVVPKGDYGQFVTSLVGKPPTDVALLTFNYDLALDLALTNSGVSFNYGIASKPSGQVPLLKLHGSLNWTGCAKCHQISPTPIEEIIRGLRPPHKRAYFSLCAVNHLRQHANPACSHCQSEELEIPVLVPPSWNKSEYHRAFQGIWERAAAELHDAEEVTVIGYSFPKSDIFFESLLALSLSGETRIRRFTVVNPDKDVGERFYTLLGPDLKRPYQFETKTFGQYLESINPKGPSVTLLPY